MKLCKDCVHHTVEEFGGPTCAAMSFVNPVNGEMQRSWCSMARAFTSSCGPDAVAFESVSTQEAA
jgi:hypothetical protein